MARTTYAESGEDARFNPRNTDADRTALSDPIKFSEHHIPREQGRVYARDYGGAGPAFVLMHGFPDNLHIYDELIPYLVASGRRVVTFDFLGFGASDKPAGATFSFKKQLGDMEGVVNALGLDRIVPVVHDASGPAGINFTLAHPERVESLCILNSAYDDALPVHWPEMIELFATKSLNALSGAIAQSPEQLKWLLAWQPNKFVTLSHPANGRTLRPSRSESSPITSCNNQVPAPHSCSWRRISLTNLLEIRRACPS